MTSRPMDTANLEQRRNPERSGLAAVGRRRDRWRVNYVTKQPTHRPDPERGVLFVRLAALVPQLATAPAAARRQGTGLSLRRQPFVAQGFIDDTNTKLCNISGQLNYRVTDTLQDLGRGRIQAGQGHGSTGARRWCRPRSADRMPTSGIVSGNCGPTTTAPILDPVTIDDRTLNTNYNVLDNHMRRQGAVAARRLRVGHHQRRHAEEPGLRLRRESRLVQQRGRGVQRRSEQSGRPRTALRRARPEAVRQHHRSDLEFQHRRHGQPPGDDRRGEQPAISSGRERRTFRTISSRWSIPTAAIYGLLTTQQQTHIDNTSLSFEDRLKVTRDFRADRRRARRAYRARPHLDRCRRACPTAAGFPFSKTWTPVTGRVGYTWEAVPGMTFYSQYATGADVAANNIFLLGATAAAEPDDVAHL